MSPDKFTNSETFLDVGDGHQLYVHDWGNMKAKTPIVFLHGGPGSQSKDKHKNNFEPKAMRVIFFDQRGCGRSLPYGSLEHNTTQDLIEDMEKIARHLKLQSFILAGGSWGAALALAYSLRYSSRVKAMVLNGIWTCSQAETDYLDKGGFRLFYPEVWTQYLDRTPKKYHQDPSAYHFKRILGNDEQAIHESAYAYGCLEGAVLSLDDRFIPDDPAEFDPSGTRMEIHYLTNLCFLPDRYILNSAHKLKMPIWLVHGRYDTVCPPQTAYELHQKLPNSELILTISGHLATHETWNVIRTLLLQLTTS